MWAFLAMVLAVSVASEVRGLQPFFLIIVSEDILDCSASHRRAIIAHECGHLSRFHFLIWAAAGAVVLNNSVIRSGFVWIGAHIGPWVAVGAFALFLTSSVPFWGAPGSHEACLVAQDHTNVGQASQQ